MMATKSTECLVPQMLCPLVRGDTIPFHFTFMQPDDSPLDISGMLMFFTMRLDATAAGVPDLQVKTTFPSDAESVAGKGSMKVLPSDTGSLVPKSTYHFDFQLVNGPDDVFTVGRGTILVEQDMTLVVT